MKYTKKVVNMLVIGMLFAATILVFTPIENVKAVPVPEEVDLDTEYIYEVLENLTDYASGTYWKGRNQGSNGEEAAGIYLEASWNSNIEDGDVEEASRENENIDTPLRYTIKYDYDYELYINNVEIDPTCCYPNWRNRKNYDNTGVLAIPYKVIVTPEQWYKNYEDSYRELEFVEGLKKNKLLNDVEYVFLKNSGDLTGEIVYIKDYETATINETEGAIHLIEIPQDNADEAFDDAVQKVNDSNGTAFIAMVTNPVFLEQKDNEIPGAVISRLDGEKIKQSLNDNKKGYIELNDKELPDRGSFTIFWDEDYTGINKYIYLIDGNEINRRAFGNFVKYVDKKAKSKLKFKNADAFLVFDRNDDTHFMGSPGGLPIPGFAINGTLGRTIEKNDEVKFKLKRRPIIDNSKNVIGNIPADDPDAETVIIGGHYESMWGQSAMDNAVGPAIAWGVAKYFSDNQDLIKPIYNLDFVAYGAEELGCYGSKSYVKDHIGPFGKEIAVINMDVLCQDSYKNGKRFPNFTPWIFTGDDDDAYDKIWNVIDQSDYRETGISIVQPTDDNGRKEILDKSDSRSFRDKAYYHVALERWPLDENANVDTLAFWDHRSGENYQKGDVLGKVYRDDLNATAELVVDLVKLFAVSGDLKFNNVCGYTQLDLDSDGNYDSVKVDFDVISDFSESGRVESVIYQNGLPQASPIKTNLFSVEQNVTTSSNVTVTLLPNATMGNCDIRVYLNDCNGSQNDFDNTTLYLYPYNHSIADFTWELNDNNLKMINFTDMSMPSPNAVINSWNWSFGDGNYSTQQNCSHNYSEVGVFNVTLTVTDSAFKSANVTKQVETFNSDPSASFIVNSSLVMVNNPLTFNSTSSDIDGSIANWTWYFGDNTMGYGPDIIHTYNKSGFYTVSLKITDNDNSSTGVTKQECALVVAAMVDDGFIDNPSDHKWDTIQEGIDDVNDNDSIYVYNGDYQAYLVNKSISIYGESKEDVQFTFLSSTTAIDVRSHDVYIKNFTIDAGCTTGVNIISTVGGTGNTTIENGAILGSTYGVYIDNSSNNIIKDCLIDEANVGVKICNGAEYNVIDNCEIIECYNGVEIYSSSYNWIGNPSIHDWYPNNCEFSKNTNAVYIDESDHNYILGCTIDASPGVAPRIGIYLDEASNTTISTCKIFNSTQQGIYVKDSRDSKVEFCLISNNYNGIECFGTEAVHNLIVQNNISGNSYYGVYIPSLQQGNKVFFNDFFDNGNESRNQSYDRNSRAEPFNEWCKVGGNLLTKSGSGEGNYWNDYTGSDLDRDGIGDSEYGIEGDGEEDDDYPLMEAYGWCSDWD